MPEEADPICCRCWVRILKSPVYLFLLFKLASEWKKWIADRVESHCKCWRKYSSIKVTFIWWYSIWNPYFIFIAKIFNNYNFFSIQVFIVQSVCNKYMYNASRKLMLFPFLMTSQQLEIKWKRILNIINNNK